MVKVKCKLPWDAEDHLGYIRPEGMSREEHNRIQGEILAQTKPHLRPCGKSGGVVIKKTCKCCPYCVEIIEEA